MKNGKEADKLYMTLREEGHAVYEEKRSEFLGFAMHVENEQDAQSLIRRIREAHYDARHHVYAYVLGGGVIQRYSDDGEPQGTGGMPVLEVLRKSGLDDACVVVTRYFGGILLGAGGLVRAYTAAAKLAIEAAGIITYERYAAFRLMLSYSEYQKLLARLPDFGAILDGADFADTVTLRTAVRAKDTARFLHGICELFNGRVIAEKIGERYDKA